VLESRDPLDYQTILQAKGTGDLVANVMGVAQGLHALLEQINQGNGLLGQLIRGQAQGEHKLSAEALRDSLDNLSKLTTDLDRTVVSINQGHGVAGALVSSRTDGRRMIEHVAATFDTMHHTSEQLGEVARRLNESHGLLPQLVENQRYGDEVMANLRSSSYDLSQILHKINTRPGHGRQAGQRSGGLQRGIRDAFEQRRLGLLDGARLLQLLPSVRRSQPARAA
jgi:ABC-type transporter Mla subunit MlaD